MLNRLTFTRIIAASIVVFFHYGRETLSGLPDAAYSVLTAGPTAVSYFYTLSGFIMVMVYAEISWSGASQYWIARFARIYPIYGLGILLCFLLVPVGGRELWSNLLLVQAWQPGIALSVNPVNWSLSVEVFFYALFPGLMILARTISLRSWLAAVAAAWLTSQLFVHIGFAKYYGGYPSPSHDLLFYFPLVHLNSFLVGMTAGLFVQRGNIQLSPTGGWCLTLVALALSFWGVAFLPRYSGIIGFTILTTNGLVSPAFGLLIIGLYFSPSRPVEANFARFLGESSYAIYILQAPLALFVLPKLPLWLGAGPQDWFWVYFAALVGLSAVSFSILERPARELIKSTFSRIRRPASVAPVARFGD